MAKVTFQNTFLNVLQLIEVKKLPIVQAPSFTQIIHGNGLFR